MCFSQSEMEHDVKTMSIPYGGVATPTACSISFVHIWTLPRGWCLRRVFLARNTAMHANWTPDHQWKIHYEAIKFYEKSQEDLKKTGDREDIVIVWKVQLPDFTLRNLLGATFFGRRRWFFDNPSAITPDTRQLLRSTAPGYIECEWEKWKEPQPWLSLLALWTPQFLQKQLGQPLASLQLLVDLADHVRTRNLLPLDEKSRTTTALLTSAESLLKWPTHYLTLLSQERGHPLKEVRTQPDLLWSQEKIRLEFLIRYATNYSQTLNLVHELRNELLSQLTQLHSTKYASLNLLLSASESQAHKKPRWMVSEAEPPKPPTAPPKPDETQRQKNAQDELLDKMAKRCREDRR